MAASSAQPGGSSTTAAEAAAADVVFRQWRGKWTVHRTVHSRHATEPSGVFSGAAAFEPTAQPNEYLYTERGKFAVGAGAQQTSFSASRSYIYAWHETEQSIESYLVAGGGAERDSFFHTLRFLLPAQLDAARTHDVSESTEGTTQATGEHWCRDDLYSAVYHFDFDGGFMNSFGVTWIVAGPRHDYTSIAIYTRSLHAA